MPVLSLSSVGGGVFELNQSILVNLDASQAVSAFRDLLWSRAAELKIPSTRISISSNVTTPDGGIDASVIGEVDPQFDDELLAGNPRYQIKTGNFKPWQKSQVDLELFGAEKKKAFANLGSEIQRMLEDSARFIVVAFGVDPTDRELRKAEENFLHAFRNCGYPHASVQVWGQTQLLSLFRRYPSLCLSLRGHDHHGFRSHDSWSSDEDMQLLEHYSSDQQQLIDELRHALESGEVPHVRLIGEPGIGKTRFAKEITCTKSLSPISLYVKDGRTLLQSSFLNELLQTEDKRVVCFVIDECSQKDIAEIWNMMKPRSNRLRVISIDHGPDHTFDDKTKVITVEPANEEQIVDILKDHDVGENDAKRWADFCEGSPRVAHVLGENLRSHRSDLLVAPTTSEVWRRFIDGYDSPDSDAVQLRQVVLLFCSLFERFGFSHPVGDEAEYIQKLAYKYDPRISPSVFKRIVNELRGRKIIQGEKTLYITPRLLHVHLYREFWNLYGDEFDISGALNDMPRQMSRWFVHMLRYRHECTAAENAITRLFGPDGMFPSGEFEDSQDSGRMISILAETCPKPSLACLRRTIGRMETAELRKVTRARQQLIWALEKLAVWEECFADAAELLLALAEADPDNCSADASRSFEGLFSLVPGFGPTQAGPSVRVEVLESALNSESAVRREICLRACAKALYRGPLTRMVGPEYQGVRPRIQFWIPETYGDLWNAYLAVWELLVDRLLEWRGEERRLLISTIIDVVWSVIDIPLLTDSVVQTLQRLAKDEDTNIKRLLESIQQQLRYEYRSLSAETKKSLTTVVEQLEGYDFSSTLKRYVKHWTREDFYKDNLEPSNTFSRKIAELAKLTQNDAELLRVELPWLVCEESSPLYSFAFKIGEFDLENSWFDEIVEQYEHRQENATTSFLSGYLAGVYDRDVDDWETLILRLADNPATADRFSDFVICSGMTNRIALRVVSQCRSGLQSKERLQRWWFDRQIQTLEEEVVQELIRLQLEDRTGLLWGNAVQMCHQFYFEKDNAKVLPEDLVFELLSSEAMLDGRVASSSSYYWSRLANAFLSQFPQRKWELFERVVRISMGEQSVLEELDLREAAVISTILRENPTRAWGCIARIYDEISGVEEYRLQHWLGGGYRIYGEASDGPIQFIGEDELFAWVDEDLEERANFLTRVLPKTFNESKAGRLTRNFVARYGKNERIRNGLHAHFHSCGWSGNASNYFRELREDAREWLAGEKDKNVRRWLEDYIENLSNDIERAEIEEERVGLD
ncbi:hypothetical protein KOR42_41580 [Thalassoglobus neptunius]|uniref:Uncharacterized protein n=2 Tax=Thalassoglobus neptunius TaxID=1938619 RepID=A0A5C5W926_9PLAN|nr:hypothetical protein KOR42_41580 [Thalassoglobus neptunius]